MKKTFFDKIESKIKNLVEGNPLKYSGDIGIHQLTKKLLILLNQNLKFQSNGSILAPDIFYIIVTPESIDIWNSNQNLLMDIAESLYKTGIDAGYCFMNKPSFYLLSSEKIDKKEFNLELAFSETSNKPEKLENTTIISIENNLDIIKNHIPHNAYFIVNGIMTIKLDKIILNIGRGSNSDIVLEDPQVSREHLQLRAFQNTYQLFDLNSTGGTFINGIRIHNALLYPGDIIQIGSSTLIYNQDIDKELVHTAKIDFG